MKPKPGLDIDALVAAAVPPRPNPQLAFTIPGLRVDSHTNSRGRWVRAWARGKKEKEALFSAWVAAVNKRKHARPVSVPCVVRLIRVGPKRLDDDNLPESFKTIRDAIAFDLGLDDGSELIKWEYAQVAIGRREYRVRVEVY